MPKAPSTAGTRGPEIRITAMPARPAAVAQAKIVAAGGGGAKSWARG